jgi:hypothetical protein
MKRKKTISCSQNYLFSNVVIIVFIQKVLDSHKEHSLIACQQDLSLNKLQFVSAALALVTRTLVGQVRPYRRKTMWVFCLS